MLIYEINAKREENARLILLAATMKVQNAFY